MSSLTKTCADTLLQEVLKGKVSHFQFQRLMCEPASPVIHNPPVVTSRQTAPQPCKETSDVITTEASVSKWERSNVGEAEYSTTSDCSLPLVREVPLVAHVVLQSSNSAKHNSEEGY